MKRDRRLAITSRPFAAPANHDQAIDTDVPAVVFEAVSLAFDDNVVLREVSFSVRAGHMTILLGASGGVERSLSADLPVRVDSATRLAGDWLAAHSVS